MKHPFYEKNIKPKSNFILFCIFIVTLSVTINYIGLEEYDPFNAVFLVGLIILVTISIHTMVFTPLEVISDFINYKNKSTLTLKKFAKFTSSIFICIVFFNTISSESSSSQQSSIKKEQQIPSQGMYFVRDCAQDNFKPFKFIACNTPENYNLYNKYRSDINKNKQIASLFNSNKCVELQNKWEDEYKVRIDKINESGIITEITKLNLVPENIENEMGNKIKYYTNFDYKKGIFSKSECGDDDIVHNKEVVDRFYKNKVGRLYVVPQTIVMCDSLKSFNRLFYTKHPTYSDSAFWNSVKKISGCIKIEPQTKIKAVSIDEIDLWCKYTIITGEHKGKLLWGAPLQ